MSKTECPHCKNTTGFAFGTCCECGFNYISGAFERIKVWVEDLPDEDRSYLIRKHADMTRRG